MAEVVDTVFELSGLSPDYIPMTLGELVPWLVRITVGVTCLSGVFAFLGKLTDFFRLWRRW